MMSSRASARPSPLVSRTTLTVPRLPTYRSFPRQASPRGETKPSANTSTRSPRPSLSVTAEMRPFDWLTYRRPSGPKAREVGLLNPSAYKPTRNPAGTEMPRSTVAVGVGVDEAVGVAVAVGDGVGVAVPVGIGVDVGVTVGVRVGVPVGGTGVGVTVGGGAVGGQMEGTTKREVGPAMGCTTVTPAVSV